MNESDRFMKKIDFLPAAYPQLQVELVYCVRELAAAWLPGERLADVFWRFYHCQRPGAEVLADGAWVPLLPDSVYLVPPFADLPVRCAPGDIGHLYVHFTVFGLTPAKRPSIHRLPLDAAGRGQLEELRGALAAGERARAGLLAAGLCGRYLGALPERTAWAAPADPRVARACAALRENPGADRDVAELARGANLAVEPFIRLFKRDTGLTPYRYLQRQRYSLAARLLAESDLPVDDVCAEVGVKDRFHFSREFKKLYGVPPGAYRKRRAISPFAPGGPGHAPGHVSRAPEGEKPAPGKKSAARRDKRRAAPKAAKPPRGGKRRAGAARR